MDKFKKELKEREVVIINNKTLEEVKGGNSSCLICFNDLWRRITNGKS
jgi:hypothetical protein